MNHEVVRARLFKGPRDGDYIHLTTDYITERKPIRVSVIQGELSADPSDASVSWEWYEPRVVPCVDLSKPKSPINDPEEKAVAMVWAEAENLPIHFAFGFESPSAMEGVFQCPVSFGEVVG